MALRVLTWNIGRLHLGARLNRWLGLDSRAAAGALPHVAEVVGRSGADVVALQELADREQAERLARLLGPGWSAYAAEREACDRRVALLVRGALGPSYATVDTAGGRTMATAQVRAGGAGWAIASVHTDPFDGEVRQAQLRAAAAWARAQGGTALLAGDLNLDPHDPLVPQPRDEATYRELARELSDLGALAGPTALARRRIDYVLGREGVVGRACVLRRMRVRLGDHDPLVAELRLAAR